MILEVQPRIVDFGGDSCGPACWFAKGTTCRCCCGGENHGVATPQQYRPGMLYRTRRVGTKLYWLAAFGTLEDCREACAKYARPIPHHSYGKKGQMWTPDLWCHRDYLKEAGILKQEASEKQLASWPEFKDYPERRAWLLWVEVTQ